jgi:predicted RND superfamily exporter protein
MTITEDKFALKYARFVIRWRVPILVLLLIATALLATQVPKLDVRNDPDTLLPGVNRYVATNLYAEEKFGMGNLMVFAVKIKEGDIFQPWFIRSVMWSVVRSFSFPEGKLKRQTSVPSRSV